jgi:hypothetical protein
MESHPLDGHHERSVTVDLCFPCHLIWFDGTESMQLSAGATLDLCRLIQARGNGTRRALAEACACPRCRNALAHTQDLTRSGRFFYYRCTQAHGRATPFFQFLREKHFVRSLTAAEIARMRAYIREVRCSSCGAPVDIERDAKCGHCGTALAMLDPEAVEKAVAALSKAERMRTSAHAATATVDRAPAPASGDRPLRDHERLEPRVDLVDAGIRALGELLDRL